MSLTYELAYLAIKPKLTDEFLATLHEVACVDGHMGDFVETEGFVRRMFEHVGKQCPPLIAGIYKE